MLLIGSRAARIQFPDFRSPNKDWDLVGTPQEITAWVKTNQSLIRHHTLCEDKKLHLHLVDGKKLEIVFARPGSPFFALLDHNRDSQIMDFYGTSIHIATPSSLLMLKKSHIHRPIHWLKNIADYHFFKSKGITLSIAEEVLLIKLREVVDERSKDNQINLNKTNDEFFKQSQSKLKRTFEHDDLHRATCYYDEPLFESLKVDKDKALVLKDRFLALSYEDKVRLVREECFAIALERKIIPTLNTGGPFDAKDAFLYALQRISTTLTKGWFRDFALENYPEICDNDRDYVNLFMNKLWNEGEVHV